MSHWLRHDTSKTSTQVYMYTHTHIWVVVKIMVPLWVLNIIRHLIFKVPKKGPLILTTTHIYIYMYVCRNMWVPAPRECNQVFPSPYVKGHQIPLLIYGPNPKPSISMSFTCKMLSHIYIYICMYILLFIHT